jgi:hypothetical protein
MFAAIQIDMSLLWSDVAFNWLNAINISLLAERNTWSAYLNRLGGNTHDGILFPVQSEAKQKRNCVQRTEAEATY